MSSNSAILKVNAVALAVGLIFSITAQAEVVLNAGSRLSYDDNVNGSPDRQPSSNQEGDTYLTANASAVYYTPIDATKSTYFIGQVGALTSAFSRFSNLNNSMLIASAGLYKQFTPNWSGQVTGRGFLRDTRQDARDSDGFGATIEIKRQLGQNFWVKAVADYEDSEADLSAFSYTGETYGVNFGYLPFQNTFVNFGYNYTKRDFDTASSFRTTTNTLFTEVTQRLSTNWYLNGGYAYRDNDSNFSGTSYDNHTVSVGVSYSYQAF